MKTPQQIASEIIKEMKDAGLDYDQMIEVIKLAKVKLYHLRKIEIIEIDGITYAKEKEIKRDSCLGCETFSEYLRKEDSEKTCRRIKKYPNCPKVPRKNHCENQCGSWF